MLTPFKENRIDAEKLRHNLRQIQKTLMTWDIEEELNSNRDQLSNKMMTLIETKKTLKGEEEKKTLDKKPFLIVQMYYPDTILYNVTFSINSPKKL